VSIVGEHVNVAFLNSDSLELLQTFLDKLLSESLAAMLPVNREVIQITASSIVPAQDRSDELRPRSRDKTQTAIAREITPDCRPGI
jgi:hypothetical protein